MFKNKSKENGSSSSSSSSSSSTSGSTNSIVSGTRIEGTINANSDIRIDGSLKGTLDCKGRVIIGPEGKVEGEINCQNAVVEGSFQGKINVKELLNVRENANIQGEVTTDKLLVQPGAIYNVSCSMGGQTIKAFGKKETLKIKEGA
ncbi:MAG: polymer-forming cytoskeletal protein [Saprospiraceae bacterium]|nr:polymer-forming cytoskeletal protein [Saprospiraceae bacterium]